MVEALADVPLHCALVLTDETEKLLPEVALQSGVGIGRQGGWNGGGSMYSVPEQFPDFHQERPLVPPRTGS